MLQALFKQTGLPTATHPMRYEYQIKKMVEKVRAKGIIKLFEKSQDEVALFNFNFDAQRAAIAIATDVRKERYWLSPPTQRLIETKSKKRIVYDYNITDKIVINVFSQLLNELLEKVISENSYAFRVGKKPLDVLTNLSSYIRKQYNEGHKAVYVFRTDFVAFSDEINVMPNSVLWENIRNLFEEVGITPSAYQSKLIESMIRPEFYNFENALQCNCFGAPTGSAIITFINNLYAHEIDRSMSKDSSMFYARYCDDILICHSDKSVVEAAKSTLMKKIHEINLRVNPKKDFTCRLSTSGYSEDKLYPGTNRFDYLGYSVTGAGLICLSKPRQRKFLRLMFRRIDDLYLAADTKDVDKLGRLIAQSINDFYTKFLIGEQSAKCIIRESSDHGHLKNLDYLIALHIAEKLARTDGVRAFRKVSYQTIRNSYGLLSLVNLRNAH